MKDLLNDGWGEVSVITSLPHEKILDWSKLKAFADDKIKMTEKL